MTAPGGSRPNLEGMARSHLTLAALATSAVAGLDIVRAREFSRRSSNEFDSAQVVDADGRQLLVRAPVSESTAALQAEDLVALHALSRGARSRLPFDVPVIVGQTPEGAPRAVVYEFLPGEVLSPDAVYAGDELAGSIGRSLAAIHALPASVVAEAGLPVLSTEECQSSTLALVERSLDTSLIPATLRARWESALADSALWEFAPTVIHGAVTSDTFLVADERVTAMIGWAALRVGDPARDLHWLSSLRLEAQESVFDAYSNARRATTDRKTHQRSTLYAELEVARWLLHGTQVRSDEIIDDAVQMLDRMVDNVRNDIMNPLSDDTGPIMAISEVEHLLETTPGDRATSDYNGLEPVTDDQAAVSSDSE